MCRPGVFFFRLIFLLLGVHAQALEVRESRWGFDGRVVPGRMTILSVLLANPGQGTFDGPATVRETGGVGGQQGAPLVQPIFLSPRAERWVQFVVFINSGYEDFVLEWGRGAQDRLALPRPTTGPPGRVLLSDAADPFARGAGLKLFPDTLFPTSVAATDGLDGVVLDYVPRWEATRREAFLDWVRRGGTVIVLPGKDGRFPQFTDALAPLNLATDYGHLGAGTVVRAPGTRREAGEGLFQAHGFPPLELQPGRTQLVYDFERLLFQGLAQLTRPKLSWWLINSLTGLYVLVVGPLHYRLARRLDYRLAIGAFVGFVVLFGALFSAVGRRGYDEAQTVHSLSIARALEPGRHDVTQWISAFATRGDLYRLTHGAPANYYAAVSAEAIHGQILNGKDGQFAADIPQYSSRQFVHRAVLPGADTSVTVERWESGVEVMNELVLKAGPAFPRDAVEIRARYREHFYRLERKGDRLTIAETDRGQPFSTFMPQTTVQNAMAALGGGANEANQAGDDLRAKLPLLYLRALDGRDFFQQTIKRAPQPPDHLQIFVFARSPESFRLQGRGFGGETGYTLYVQEIWKP